MTQNFGFSIFTLFSIIFLLEFDVSSVSHADVKNVKITKSVLSLTKYDQIPAICSGYLCDFMKKKLFVKVS